MTDDVHLVDFEAYLKDLTAGSEVDKGADEAEVLLLTCMDFRFFKLISASMERLGLAGDYDHVILAGAALGAVVPQKPHWHQTFFDHLELARDLHKIKGVLVMEHKNCGAYGPKGFRLLPDNPTPAEERRVHWEQVGKLKGQIPRGLWFGAFLLDVPPKTDALTYDQLV